MADIDFDDYEFDYEPGPARGHRLERVMHLAGAALSVALLAGGVWWGWQLAVLDVSGVPVMRALGGPMRVAPSDPGGNVATNLGLSVNAVAAVGTATVLPEKLTLAPETPGLAAEDAPGLALPVASLEAPAVTGTTETIQGIGLSGDAALTAVATEIPGADQDAVAAALAEALAAPEPAAPGVPGFAPRPRPGAGAVVTLASASATDSALASDTAMVVPGGEVEMASVAPGTWLVQLGAFETPEAARADWARIAGRYPELMADKGYFIQPSVSGGRTFYRLRALEFADDAESRRFCLVLLADNASCVPVIHRIE